jgi:hypothetical protein
MNIAILFSGRIRKFASHYNNIMDNLVQGNNVDFFLSHSPELNEDLAMFQDLYNPVSVCNEPLELFDYTQFPVPDLEHRPHNIVSMFYNKKRVFKMLNDYIEKTGKVYDIVISHRLDLFCFNKLDYNIINNGLCIPKFNGTDMFDQFAFGTIQSMEPYMNAYDHIQTLLQNGFIFNAERILDFCLKNIHVFRFTFHTRLIRVGGHGYSSPASNTFT